MIQPCHSLNGIVCRKHYSYMGSDGLCAYAKFRDGQLHPLKVAVDAVRRTGAHEAANWIAAQFLPPVYRPLASPLSMALLRAMPTPPKRVPNYWGGF